MPPNADRRKLFHLPQLTSEDIQHCALLSPTSFLGFTNPPPPVDRIIRYKQNDDSVTRGKDSSSCRCQQLHERIKPLSADSVKPCDIVFSPASVNESSCCASNSSNKRQLAEVATSDPRSVMISSPDDVEIEQAGIMGGTRILRRQSSTRRQSRNESNDCLKDGASKHTALTHLIDLKDGEQHKSNKQHLLTEAEFSTLALPSSMSRGIPLPATAPLIPPRVTGVATTTHVEALQHNIHPPVRSICIPSNAPIRDPRTGVTNQREHDASYYRNPKNHVQGQQGPQNPSDRISHHKHSNKTLTEAVRESAWMVGSTEGVLPVSSSQIRRSVSALTSHDPSSGKHKEDAPEPKSYTESHGVEAMLVEQNEEDGKDALQGEQDCRKFTPCSHTGASHGVALMNLDGTKADADITSTGTSCFHRAEGSSEQTKDVSGSGVMRTHQTGEKKNESKRPSISSSLSSGMRSVQGSLSKQIMGAVGVLGSTGQYQDADVGTSCVPLVVHAPRVSSAAKPSVASAPTSGNNKPPSYSHSLYEDKLFHRPNTTAVEAVLGAACEGMGFEIAEMWLRTGAKTHQLIHSHVRPTALEERVAAELVDVYYGERSCERVHRLSPALCKRAKEASDVIWVTSYTAHGADALRCSISDVRTAVAVPICHMGSHTNMTLIFFSIKRAMLKPPAVEFLVHMSLSSAAIAVNTFSEELFDPLPPVEQQQRAPVTINRNDAQPPPHFSHHQQFQAHERIQDTFLAHGPEVAPTERVQPSGVMMQMTSDAARPVQMQISPTPGGNHQPMLFSAPSDGGESATHAPTTGHGSESLQEGQYQVLVGKPFKINFNPSPSTLLMARSVGGARLDMKWGELSNVEYLTDGGNNWIHTAVVNGKPGVVKTLKPECQDVAVAINELESELQIHSKLQHPHICELMGAGLTSKGNRFVVLERLDGGTLAQVLGYDTLRIRDRRRRFWRKKLMSFGEVLSNARALADALAYCHARAVSNGMVLHRDLKPDNIGFTLDGTLKLLDFGLSRIVHNASPYRDDLHKMSGETGSLRYMAPEVAANLPYNHKADVYSFGIILWELLSRRKPYEGMNRSLFYQRVVHGGERPLVPKKWPRDLQNLLQDCWTNIIEHRPNFEQVEERLELMLRKEYGDQYGKSGEDDDGSSRAAGVGGHPSSASQHGTSAHEHPQHQQNPKKSKSSSTSGGVGGTSWF